MQKTIYEGESTGLFSRSNFYDFMEGFPQAELVLVRGLRGNERFQAYYEIKPEGVSLAYDSMLERAKVTLSGKEDNISEIERRILNEAEKYKQK